MSSAFDVMRYGKRNPVAGTSTTGEEYKGEGYGLDAAISIAQDILIALRMIKPSVIAIIDGQDFFDNNVPVQYSFMLGAKRVPASKILIQNNAANPIAVGLSEMAVANADFQLTNVAPNNILLLNDCVLDYVSFINTVAGNINVNRIRNKLKKATAVSIWAWTNPEWEKFWGQI
jgi:hypothetical protein